MFTAQMSQTKYRILNCWILVESHRIQPVKNRPSARPTRENRQYTSCNGLRWKDRNCWPRRRGAFSALFIATVARLTSGVATLRIQPVQTLDAPELALYLTLRRIEEHERAGVLVAANTKVVKRLLASRFIVESALLTPAWLEQLEPLLRARPEGELPVYVAEQKVLETITGYTLHQGALAAAKIPPLLDFETLLKNSPRPLLLAAVEGIASAENLGALVRSCAAFGVHFLIVGETCGSPFQRRAVSGSMGTIFEQPVARVVNLVEKLTSLRARSVRCLAAHPRPGAKKLAAVDLRGDCCLVFGAEGPGLTAATLAACDDTVEIPMPSHMNSLNVAAATAVFLYEATRQRG
jgi:tRNA G18 (ribose-2'-O)-methylase SpoU